jgi:predicted O-methyltransferase YrrM
MTKALRVRAKGRRRQQMAAELISTQVREHLERFVPPRPAEMQAMEAYAKARGFPIIGPAAGYLCYQIARMINARHIFELGSGYGYSTAWFAQAVKENGGGTVHHVVWDEELSERARGHLAALGFEEIVQYHVGEAAQTLREIRGSFDLIFNDVDKEGYPDSLPVIREKLCSGGVLIIDNMLWDGRIFDENDRAPSTEGVREITRCIIKENAWIAMLIPVRDGLVVAYKK